MVILVTGVAGFIGYHTARALLERGDTVVGLDNLNDYYDVTLKQARLQQLESFEDFRFKHLDLVDRAGIDALFSDYQFARVIHLAAQAGVRYSLTNPHAYVDSNLVGFMNLLEACRHQATPHFVYASSSSVYGGNTKMPFSTHDEINHPISLYAATKRSNELMAHAYAHLFNLPCTGLRFFTVYGPFGRPDMAMFLFAEAISRGQPIKVFNHGDMQRDFTYIDDVVEGVVRVSETVPHADLSADMHTPDRSSGPFRIFNIGNHQPVELNYVIELLETHLGRKAKRHMLPLQAGDVPTTYADIEALQEAVGFSPSTPIEVGVERFIAWYQQWTKSHQNPLA